MPFSTSSDPPLVSPKSNLLVTSSPTSLSSIQISNGRVGLDNLGNTCYMNSSLQALLHTNFLNEYFLMKLYLRDMNKSNRHGYGGRLAAAYATLVNDLWCTKQSDQLMGHAIAVMTDAMNAVTTSGHSPTKAQQAGGGAGGGDGFVIGPSSVNPRKFRKEVGALREQFAGDDQHDAQEVLYPPPLSTALLLTLPPPPPQLLSFLLDGLSEDLNLVETKPYIEQPDSDDRPDQILADIWWENHLKRDISAIQSIFTGQFKSITTCKHCQYNSARYEPFNMLSVPLPEDSHRSLVVYVFTLTSHFFSCSVRIPKVGSLKDVVEILKSYRLEDGVGDDSLFLPVQMSNFRVLNILTLAKPIDTIRESDFLVFYQVKEIPVTRSLPTVVTSKENVTDGAPVAAVVGATGRYGRVMPPLKAPVAPALAPVAQSTGPMNSSKDEPTVGQPEMEREVSYDGDSDSGEELEHGAGDEEEKREVGPIQQIPLGEDFLPDVEAEITGDGLSPLGHDKSRQDTVSPLSPSLVLYSLISSQIEVVFIHRRVKFTSVGGIEMFKMEQIALPLLEVLPVRVSAVEMYSLISKRVSVHLKSSVSLPLSCCCAYFLPPPPLPQIPDLAKSNLLSVNVVGSPALNNSFRQKKNSMSSPQLHHSSSPTSDSFSNKILPRSHSNLSMKSESLGPSRIRPIATQDAIGGDIPPHGFVLR
jgi:hypothetical protein